MTDYYPDCLLCPGGCRGHNRSKHARPLRVTGGTDSDNVVRGYIPKPKEAGVSSGPNVEEASRQTVTPRKTQAQIAWEVWSEKAEKHQPDPSRRDNACRECGGFPLDSGYCETGDWARHHLVEIRDHKGLLVPDDHITAAEKAFVLGRSAPS